MQRGVQQTNGNRSFLHCLVDALEVILLERLNAFQCRFSFLYGIGHNHLSEFHDSVSRKEHVLCSGQTDTLCTEVDCCLCIVGCVGICSNLQHSLRVSPSHEGLEVACNFCLYGRNIFAVDVACGAIQRDIVPFLEGSAAQCKGLCFFVHLDFFAAGYTAGTHTTRNNRCVRGHTTTHCQDTLRCCHTFDILRRGFQTNQNNSVACFCSSLCFLCCEINLTCGSAGGCGQPLAQSLCSLQCSLVECRVQQLVKLFGFYSQQSLVCCNQTLVYHFNRDSQSRVCSSLTVSCLQEEQLAFFNGEFHILHIFIMLFQCVCDIHELIVNTGHIFLQLCNGVRCTNTGNYVLALCIYQIFTQHSLFACSSVSCEGNTCTRGITHIAEYHHLYVYGSTPAVRDIVHSSVNESTGIIPATEYSHCCFQKLFLGILREFLALVIQINLLEDSSYLFQILCCQVCVIFCANTFLVFIQLSFKFGFGNTDNNVCKHHDKSSVGVISKSCISCLLCQTFYGNIIQPKVQNSIHHTGHGCSRTGTNGNQQGIFRVAQLLACDFLQLCQSNFNLVDHFICQLLAAFVVFRTSLCGNGEAIRNRQSQICHFSKVSAFAAQQVSHARVAFAEHINIFLAHYSLPPVINFG